MILIYFLAGFIKVALALIIFYSLGYLVVRYIFREQDLKFFPPVFPDGILYLVLGIAGVAVIYFVGILLIVITAGIVKFGGAPDYIVQSIISMLY
jgi:hypothetical protein